MVHISDLWWTDRPPEYPDPYKNYPYDTWFSAQIHATAYGWPGASPYPGPAIYEFRRISPSGGHKYQLAIRSPIDRADAGGRLIVRANVIYVLCEPGDTPNWGSVTDLVTVSPPCANWNTAIYIVPDQVTRSQSWGLNAAISTNRNLSAGIAATCAKTDSLDVGISAYAASQRQRTAEISAYIQGDTTRYIRARAAIKAERLLEPGIVTACAKTDSLDVGISAYAQGNPILRPRLRAAIIGESEAHVGIVALVVKSRVDKILLEMENLWPQELDLRSTPNWPSRIKDYRKDSLD